MILAYCAKIVDGVVAQVIVCRNAEWAASHLGGEWTYSGEQLVSVGWTYNADDGFRPPSPYPSFVWDGEAWMPPIHRPDGDGWWWDENALQWQPAVDNQMP